jgi:ribosome-associated protein
MIRITQKVSISEEECSFSFVRSGGPGGQNVNKVSTAVRLRFDVLRSSSLSQQVRQRLIKIAGTRATVDGILLISASRFRTQERNRADAIERLTQFIRKALDEPKKRKKSKPTFASKGRRITGKRLLGEKKKFRKIGEGDFE